MNVNPAAAPKPKAAAPKPKAAAPKPKAAALVKLPPDVIGEIAKFTEIPFCVSKGVNYDLKDDREAVLAAVRRNGNALRYASAELKADRKVVIAALCQNINAERWAALPAGDLQVLIHGTVAKRVI
jgi:hypothetical protein